MPRKRHVPIRMCLICGQRRPKGELLRIVRKTDGSVTLDEGERINGRGCYVCTEAGEIDTERISDKIKSTLKLDGDVPDEVMQAITAQSRSS